MHVDLPKKMYYTIGEVAKAFGVKTSLIRFWDGEFSILKPKKKRQRKQTIYNGRYKKLKTYISFG